MCVSIHLPIPTYLLTYLPIYLSGDPNKCPSSLGYSLIECRCLKLYHDSVAYLLAKYLCAVDQGHLYYYKNLEVDEPAIVHVLQTSGVYFR